MLRRSVRAATAFIALLVSCGSVRVAAQSVPPALQLPGAPAFSPSLQQELRSAWKAQAGASQPRTSHLNADGSPQYINRLVLSRSPYLQQHAFNPVNWYPWGDEAFATAKRENKPVFLSIGYATCHWCHVMEHECFEEEAIAKLLNENFIAVKVDREERPDIDAVYIAAVQRMTGSAGWPLSVFLTSDRQPFYGGTYFPPEDAGNRPGFPKLLKMLKTAWDTKRDSVVEASTEITKAVRDAANMSPGGTLDEVVLLRAAAHFATMFDPVNGGFGKAPKFPQAHVLRFLCRYSYRTGDAVAQNMAFASLDHMARGGMNDLIGGGFHRYSTDAEWRVPHYEKMLYDQAMDAQAYLEAMRASDGAAFRDTPREIFTYVLRDMTSPDGAFYTAEDADSGGEEGRFYTWTRKELVGVLGPQDGPLFADLFGMNDSEVPQPLTLAVNTADFLKQRKINPQQFVRTMAKMRVGLMSERLKRPRPARDDKIITAWNGLMIAALADGAKTLHDENLAVAAARAADFVLTHLQRDGRLLRVYRGSAGTIPGYLDDYAYLIHGLHELYEATFESRWLLEADRLSREMIRLFDDPATGALRYAADDHEKLIAASNSLEDQALPAPQSVAAYELLRLGRLTMNKAYESRGRALLALNGADVEQSPTAYAFRLMALDFAIGPTQEIVLAGARNDPKIKGLATTLYSLYAPRAVVALHDADDKKIEQLVPFLRQQNMVGGRATAYVCENYVCKLPTSEVEKLRSLVLAIRDSQAKADKAAGEQHTSPPAPAPLP